MKAPFRERPESGGWCGDESDKIAEVMAAANKQFRDDQPNILLLVPDLRVSMYQNRDGLIRGAYGFSQLAVPINLDTGETGEPYEQFVPGGKFLNRYRPDGKPLKSDGFPGCRRISAVILVEEVICERHPMPDLHLFLCEKKLVHDLWPHWDKARRLHFSEDNRAWVDHKVLVLHNPHAHYTLPADIWPAYPQFVTAGNSMRWTDGHAVCV